MVILLTPNYFLREKVRPYKLKMWQPKDIDGLVFLLSYQLIVIINTFNLGLTWKIITFLTLKQDTVKNKRLIEKLLLTVLRLLLFQTSTEELKSSHMMNMIWHCIFNIWIVSNRHPKFNSILEMMKHKLSLCHSQLFREITISLQEISFKHLLEILQILLNDQHLS